MRSSKDLSGITVIEQNRKQSSALPIDFRLGGGKPPGASNHTPSM